VIGRLSATFGGALTSGPAAVASPAYAINVIVRGPDNVFTTRSCCLDGRLNEFCASDAEDFGISETTTKGLITSAVLPS
jgi:hypothetical protein